MNFLNIRFFWVKFEIKIDSTKDFECYPLKKKEMLTFNTFVKKIDFKSMGSNHVGVEFVSNSVYNICI